MKTEICAKTLQILIEAIQQGNVFIPNGDTYSANQVLSEIGMLRNDKIISSSLIHGGEVVTYDGVKFSVTHKSWFLTTIEDNNDLGDIADTLKSGDFQAAAEAFLAFGSLDITRILLTMLIHDAVCPSFVIDAADE